MGCLSCLSLWVVRRQRASSTAWIATRRGPRFDENNVLRALVGSFCQVGSPSKKVNPSKCPLSALQLALQTADE